MVNIGELEVGFKLNEASFKQAKDKIKSELQDAGIEWGKALSDAVGQQTNLIGKLTGQFSQLKSMIIGTFAVGGITSMISGLFNLTGKAESARKSMITLTGSVEQADKQLKMIGQFASKTPFSRTGAIQLTQQMIGMGFQAKQTLPILNAVGNAVSAMGGSQDQLNGVVLALWQMQTKGKVSTQELLQMAERGLPVFEILGKKLNLTKEQLGDIGNQAISSSVAIPALLEGLNERFAGSLEGQSKTLLGKRSNIQDTFEQRVITLGEKLYPIFSTVLDLIAMVMEPLFGVATLIGQTLALAFQWLGIVASGVIQGIVVASTFLRDNRVAIIRAILATFLSALIIMKREAIVQFVQGAMGNMVASLKTFRNQLKIVMNVDIVKWLKGVALSARGVTVQLYTQTVARVKNTATQIRQIFVNGATALSFKAVGGSIMWVIRTLLILAGQFLLIGALVAIVVAVIYANWAKIKEKLKPLFEFIAKIGAKAPEVIAKGWNTLVDVVVGAFQAILSVGQSLANWLKKYNIDIGVGGIEEAIVGAEKFRQKMQITTQDVSGAFSAIGDLASDTFTAVTGAFGDATAGADLLGNGALDVAGNFDSMGNSAEGAGKKAKEGSSEAETAMDKAKKKADEYANKVEKLEDVTKKYAERHKEFYDGILDSIREVDTKLQDNIQSYDELIAKIKEEGQARLDSNTKDFFTKQAQDQVKLESDLAGITSKIEAEKTLAETKKLSATNSDDVDKYTIQTNELDKQKLLLEEIVKLQEEARNFTATTTKEEADKNIARQAVLNQTLDELENNESISDATKTQLELTRERFLLLQQIAEIQKNLISEEAKSSGVDIGSIQSGARQSQASSTQGAELLSFKEKQGLTQKETDEKIADEEKKFLAEQERLNKLKVIYQTFYDDQLKGTQALNTLLDEETLKRSTVEEQRTIIKLQTERQNIIDLNNQKIELEQDLLNKKAEMTEIATQLMLEQGRKTRDDVQQTINKINEAINRMNALRSASGGGGSVAGARMFGGNVDGGKSYLVWEDGPEIATFGHNATIIPNIKTMVREALAKWVSPSTLANSDGTVSNHTIDKSIKIDQVVVNDGKDWDNRVNKQKRLRR